MPKRNLNKKQEKKQLGLREGIAVCSLILSIGLLAACGDAATSPTIVAITNAANTGNTGATAADPYAGLTAQQVMDTFLKAYTAEDFETCRALMSKSVIAGWSSPDELKLAELAQEKQFGKLEIKIFGVLQDQGSTITYLVQYTRTGGSPTPTPQVLIAASPFAVTLTPPGAITTPVTRSGNFEVKREGNAWKISNYTVI